MADDVKDKLVTLEDLKAVTDTINDETTGINLLKCTRDASIGTISTPENQYIKLNGYRPNNTNCVMMKDAEGFGVWELIGDTTSNYIYTTPAYGLYAGNYTIGFEYMLSDDFDGVALVQATHINLSLSNTTLRIPLEVERNKWHKAKHIFNVTKDGLENAFAYLTVKVEANAVGSFYIRKICIYEGNINNPIWSPSPFDMDYMTTGINLVRYSKDILIGSTKIYTGGAVYTNGFYAVRPQMVSILPDEQGFGVATINAASDSANLVTSFVPLSAINSDSITVFFEMKIGTIPSDRNILRFFEYNESVGGTTNLNQINVSVDALLSNEKNIETDKWYKCSYVYTPKSKDNFFGFGFNVPKGGVYSFRLIGAYEGRVTNPVWSPSPFDAASSSDALTRNSPVVNLGTTDSDHRIPANANLDDYLTAGTYSCPASATAKTLENCPTAEAFKLNVEYPEGGNGYYLRQRVIVYTSAAGEHIRWRENKESSTWSNWRQTYSNTTIRPIEGGGTAASTANGAQYNLLKDMQIGTSKISDDDYFVGALNSPSAAGGMVFRKQFSVMWDWIASKIRSVFGFTEDNKLPVDKVENLPTMHYCIMKYTLKDATSGQILLNLIDPSSTYITSMEKLDGEDLDGSLYLNNLIMNARLVQILDSGSTQYDARYGACSIVSASSRKMTVKYDNISLFYEPRSSSSTYAIILNIQWYK